MRDDSFRPPVTLRGSRLTLVPMDRKYRDALHFASRDPEVGRLLGTPPGRTRDAVEQYIATLLLRQAAGVDLPFVVLLRPDDRVIGACRYLRIDRENDALEIGTWIDSEYWRSPVNTELKYLLLRHAFEEEGAHRVALETDLRNERSQRAIARLGAVREGVLREDRRTPEGYRRSSVFYSILADEWPAVRRRLERYLERPWAAGAPRASAP